MKKVTYLNCLPILIFLSVLEVSAFQLTTNPANIRTGFTKTIELTCLAAPNATFNLSSLVSITVFHQNNPANDVYTKISSIDIFEGVINFQQVVVTGYIVGDEDSNLKVSWSFPSKADEGIYKCEVRGVNSVGHPVVFTTTARVTADKPDFDTLVEELRNIKANISEKCTYMGNIINKFEESKQSLFEIPSSLYNGTRYLLSKRDYYVGIYQAQATCQLYGGYLAEIDDSLEWNFVYSYLKTLSGMDYVVIDGTDEVRDGTWVSSRTKLNLKFFNWYTGEPNSGISANCIYCTYSRDFKWEAGACINTINVRYLCELKEIY